mmetsp:Transcript_7218/g.26162  ORF Transcript_7218/g.26162 Transcript_7218/m.26162 type:complete len:211 (-) Transcript_7218:1791-2423(-)
MAVPAHDAHDVADLFHAPQRVEGSPLGDLDPQFQRHVSLGGVQPDLEDDVDGAVLLVLVAHGPRIRPARARRELHHPLLRSLGPKGWPGSRLREDLLELLREPHALRLGEVAQKHRLGRHPPHQAAQKFLELCKTESGQHVQVLLDVPLFLQAQDGGVVDGLLVGLVELGVLKVLLHLLLEHAKPLLVGLVGQQPPQDLLRQDEQLVAVP